MRFDAIVVGAGSAGAVIAARLSEDPARRVLLLEAGPDDTDLASTPPDLPDLIEGRWNSTRPHDWRFRAHHSQSGRLHLMPRGRVTGGSSAVNTNIALRGLPEDYDAWAALGEPGWDLALRAAGALLAQQNPDGSWDNTGGYTTEGQRDEVTAEFVAIMGWVEQGLAGDSLDRFRPPTPAELLAGAPAGVRR